jgi:hypothetical protein
VKRWGAVLLGGLLIAVGVPALAYSAELPGSEKCAVLPAGKIGDTVGATVAFDADNLTACYTIPADQHATSELVTFTRLSGEGGVLLRVRDDAGKIVCGNSVENPNHYRERVNRCKFGAGRAYEVELSADRAGSGYRVTRKDATPAGAKCQAVTSTVLGGPASAGTVTDSDDIRCYRFTTTAADNYWVGARDATQWVTDAAGSTRCTSTPCRVTGSTSYHVFVWAPARGTPTPYRVDTWNLGTPGKPPAQCTTLRSGAPGFGPFSGTLNDERTAFCAAVPLEAHSSFKLRLSNTAGGEALPASHFFNLYDPISSEVAACVDYGLTRDCSTHHPDNVSGTALLVLAARTATATYPFRAETTCSVEPCNPEPYALTDLVPVAASNQEPLVLSLIGTSFDVTDSVVLTRNGSAPLTAAVRHVTTDRTKLTASVDLTDAAPGAWTVTATSARKDAKVTETLTVSAAALVTLKAPTVSGTVRVGATVKVVAGSWRPAATATAYQWTANGVAISGATGSSYVVPASTRGKKLAVRVTAKRANRQNTVVTSAATTVAYGVAPTMTKRPAVTGTVKAGRTVTASVGKWSPAASSYQYVWLLNGKAVKGATKAKLTVGKTWAGKKLAVTVIVKRTGHTDARATSTAITVKK